MPVCRYAKLDREPTHRHPRSRAFRNTYIALLILVSCISAGCGEASKKTNANAPAASSQPPAGNTNSNTVSSAASSQFSSIDIQEPERYSVSMTISIQETASEAPTPMVTQQFDLAKLEADRRWAFVFPAPLGQIVYLEKSGLRYLVLFERKQYIELDPNAFGFELPKVLTPNSIAERLKTHQYEQLGLEPVNGRTAIKYRLAAPNEPPTHMVFIDQETKLPLRSELNTVAASGAKSRVIVEARDVQLNPDRAQFDVPVGMKKVTQQEAKPQIEAFATALRSFAGIISGAQTAPVANAAPPPANKNAGGSVR